jgi:hypothetical protein
MALPAEEVSGIRRKAQGIRREYVFFDCFCLVPCLPCGIPALRDPPKAGFHRVNLKP